MPSTVLESQQTVPVAPPTATLSRDSRWGVRRLAESDLQINPNRRAQSSLDLHQMLETPSRDVANGNITRSPKSPRKRLSHHFPYPAQMQAVKEALHVATSPTNVACREEEQRRVLEFCKSCVEQEKAGSLYVCGCPGTGKTLSIGKVKDLLVLWSAEILEKFHPYKKMTTSSSPLQHLHNYFSKKQHSSARRMILIIIDEMDYLITKDRAVLHDLFMLTTFPFSRCILIGIANAIDLADRFLPKLESLNCKPIVVTFRAYSKDQILTILHQRLMVLGYDVFQPSVLEFCARKVAAASGDTRRALGVCMSAIEVLEADLRDATTMQEANTVSVSHMSNTLSKAFKSAVVDTLQALPQHQQLLLCCVEAFSPM